MTERPVCFIVMPFGVKRVDRGMRIDFDRIYAELIVPAIEVAGLQAVRADVEITGGVIHKKMYERIALSEFAIFDLTTSSPSIFYYLGIRHALKRSNTILMFAEDIRLSFDLGAMRGIPYTLDERGNPADKAFQGRLAANLQNTSAQRNDSPLFKLLEDPENLDTYLNRDQTDYSNRIRQELEIARSRGISAISQIEDEIGHIPSQQSDLVIDLFLSYRAAQGWEQMISLVSKMSAELRNTPMVQEQLGLALHRTGRSEEAERILLELTERRGKSSETESLLGRIFVDRWNNSITASGEPPAGHRFLLRQAIEHYVSAYNLDIRNVYPGVNAAMLMELDDTVDPRQADMARSVIYAAMLQSTSRDTDYWDTSTLLELCVLVGEKEKALQYLEKALASMREPWLGEATIHNLRLIRESRTRRGEEAGWIGELESMLSGALPSSRRIGG
jgi:tetratricopeptide (TPR) repeat protein